MTNPNRDLPNNLNNNLLETYMDFITNTNTSLHSMLSIINDQQTSFNQILREHNITTHPIARTDRYIPSTTYSQRFTPLPTIDRNTNNLRRNLNRSNNVRRVVANDLDIITELLFPSQLQTTQNVPSQNEIENAIDRVNYNTIENPINHSCPISQTDFSANDMVVKLKGCNHIFSTSYILRWFERNYECPLCRHDIRNIDNAVNETHDTTGPTYEINSPTTPLPFTQQLANVISDHLTSQRDFSGNISIELFGINPDIN